MYLFFGIEGILCYKGGINSETKDGHRDIQLHILDGKLIEEVKNKEINL